MPSKEVDIQLFNETDSEVPVDTELITAAASLISNQEHRTFSFLEVVYVDEDEIVRINFEHLNRDYVTDVITFRYDENADEDIQGTIFCCAPRIREQAEEFNQDTGTEYVRILIHGLLHLTGYKDQSPEDKKQMTSREDHYLRLLFNA